MKKQEDTLHLVLKTEWFHKIATGEKREEYREIKPYYLSRFCTKEWKLAYNRVTTDIKYAKSALFTFPRKYKYVVFQEGYRHNAPKIRFCVDGISIGHGDPNLGAPAEECFIIKLGTMIPMSL